LRGWYAALTCMIFIISNLKSDPSLILIAYIPISFFWGLEGNCLLEERRYRKLYDRVCQIDESEVDFSMDITPMMGSVRDVLKATFSKRVFEKAISVTSRRTIAISDRRRCLKMQGIGNCHYPFPQSESAKIDFFNTL